MSYPPERAAEDLWCAIEVEGLESDIEMLDFENDALWDFVHAWDALEATLERNSLGDWSGVDADTMETLLLSARKALREYETTDGDV